MPPEISTALVPWTLKRIAHLYGYGEVPVDCPYEWKSRARRYFQRRDQYAEFAQRDAEELSRAAEAEKVGRGVPRARVPDRLDQSHRSMVSSGLATPSLHL